MNKEEIQARLKKLETEQEQIKTTWLSYSGAIEDCKYWLGKLEETKETKKNV